MYIKIYEIRYRNENTEILEVANVAAPSFELAFELAKEIVRFSTAARIVKIEELLKAHIK